MKYITIPFLILQASLVLATTQVGDKFIINGETNYFGPPFPYQAFLDMSPEKIQNRSWEITSILKLRKERGLFGFSRVKADTLNTNETCFGSTCCYRNHIATWTVTNNTLYLINLSVPRGNFVLEDLRELFPNNYTNGMIEAHWYSSTIYLRKPRVTLHFKQGRLIKSVPFKSSNDQNSDNRQHTRKLYKAIRKKRSSSEQ